MTRKISGLRQYDYLCPTNSLIIEIQHLYIRHVFMARSKEMPMSTLSLSSRAAMAANDNVTSQASECSAVVLWTLWTVVMDNPKLFL